MRHPVVVTSFALARSEKRTEGLWAVAAMVAVMWLVEIVDALDNHALDGDGIAPRMLSGLAGILFAPFLHASFGHLIGNTVPLLLLGLPIAIGGLARVLEVTVIVAVVSGLGVWLVAPSSTITIGASGLVFGYASYLVGRGFFNRRAGQLAIGVLVAAAFGGALLSGLVPHSGISWQGHLFGAIGGLLAARLLTEARAARLAVGARHSLGA